MNRITITDLRTGLLFYLLSSGIVLLSVWFGHRFLNKPPHWLDDHKDYAGALCRFDGNWYLDIVQNGYSYDANKSSSVAFFPAYPLTARFVANVTGCRPEWALVGVAHFFLAATFVLLAAYVRLGSDPERRSDLVLLAFALLPTTFFLRLGYTESMFCFWCMLALWGQQRGWHPFWLALIAGAATATRGPGIAVGLIVLLAVWNRSVTWGQFLCRGLVYGLLSCWGLIAYIAYLGLGPVGDPLAFMKAQAHWNSFSSDSTGNAILSLATLEPIINTYNPESPRWWAGHDPYNHTPFSLQAANPIWFLLACGAVIWGWRTRRLAPAELLLAAGLLLIPYLTRAYPNSMGSFGRFAAVVLPVYLVMGRWLTGLRGGWVGLIAALAALWLISYSALFGAAWWLV